MKVKVFDDDGTELLSYEAGKDKGKTMCLCPGAQDRPAVRDALMEASTFLAAPSERESITGYR